MISHSKDILSRLDVDVPNVRATVRRMSGGQRQSMAIARAANWGKTLVIMDEPTAALGVRETAAVEALIRRLRDSAVTVLLISHDMAAGAAGRGYRLRVAPGANSGRRVVQDTTGDEAGRVDRRGYQGDTHG